jgi:hypothetical protein
MAKTRATPGTGSIYKHDSREGCVGRARVDGCRLRVYGKTKAEAREAERNFTCPLHIVAGSDTVNRQQAPLGHCSSRVRPGIHSGRRPDNHARPGL